MQAASHPRDPGGESEPPPGRKLDDPGSYKRLLSREVKGSPETAFNARLQAPNKAEDGKLHVPSCCSCIIQPAIKHD